MRKFLLQHADKDPVSFHMPGHKGQEIFKKYGYGEFLDRLLDCDVTEIPGADNLFQAEGIIMDAQKKYSRLYGVEHSYLLINGTSGGIIASILATVKPGRKLIMARNCHKSVFNALTLGHIQPVYAAPEYIEEYGIMGEVSPEEIRRCIEQNPEADAIILPSPNYYGICSDIDAIAGIAHEYGKVLIVDQAHGAHLKFFQSFGCGEYMPSAAEDCGADIVINSIHKTLAALTQSAVLNCNSRLVDRYILEDKLQAIESTSPSYLLMSFLDINADLLLEHGSQAMTEWREAIDYFHEEAKSIEGISLMKAGNMDITKINLDMGRLGIDGATLEKLLIQREIYPELHTGDILMLMTGIGNTRKHMERTIEALREIAGEALPEESVGRQSYTVPAAGKLHEVPREKEFVKLEDAMGRICAGSIIPYPPGIPFVCPGEEITADIVRYIGNLRETGEKVIGVNDRGEVLVGK
ncbi:MAG: aminotransferase class I/II-fold pyridoxal phosphate-dependent enzyme [Lentihominibacter sp.]